MTTDQVKLVMRRIFFEGHVPSLSFTGGEATLRPDLDLLVRHGADLGFRVNLITNGIRAASERYARRLVDAGLASAQVSLEAGEEGIHDRIVGRRGAFARTVAGVRNFQRLGIHVHTNTTLCAENLVGEAAENLIRFVARELRLRTMSMNMVIRTGVALGSRRMEVSYREVGRRLPGLLSTARAEGVKLVWYSPIPYCIFNPALHGLGAKSCACIDGILSVDPTGQVLPCSSFADGIGSLLSCSFARIYRSRAARYWRDKLFRPPVCEGCADLDLCGGACPLYWDSAGSFAEIPREGSGDPRMRRRWERQRRRGASFGVPAPVSESTAC
jgi:radical SAM protein with 4Fe4S-binding SPASM domain